MDRSSRTVLAFSLSLSLPLLALSQPFTSPFQTLFGNLKGNPVTTTTPVTPANPATTTNTAATNPGGVTLGQNKPGLCPLTGTPPFKPIAPLSRCSRDNELSCCSTCQDASASLKMLSSNGTFVFGFLSQIPILGLFLPTILGNYVDQQFCSVFTRNPQCLAHIESLFCAVSCDPNAGDFLAVNTKNRGTLTLCNDYAQQLMSTCGGLTVPVVNQTVASYVKDPLDLFNLMLSPILTSVSNLTTLTALSIPGTTNCFTAAPPPPTPSLCCDPLSSVPSECLASAGVTNRALVNRALPPTCPPSPSASTTAPGGTAQLGALGQQGEAAGGTVITAQSPPQSDPKPVITISKGGSLGFRVCGALFGLSMLILGLAI